MTGTILFESCEADRSAGAYNIYTPNPDYDI
jgi:hypothetical protein